MPSAPRVNGRSRARSRPSSSDVGFAVVGLVALLALVFTIPLEAPTLPARVTAVVLLTAAGAIVAALPGLLVHGFLGNWPRFMIWWGRALIFLTLLIAVGDVISRREPPASLLTALANGQVTIDRFVRAERAAAPGMFDRRLLRGNERALRQSFPDGEFSDVSLVGVTEGDGWMRAHLTYQGALKVEGRSVHTSGQMVIYYHPGGTAMIGAACTAPRQECRRIEPLLASAERLLRDGFTTGGLDGLLPPTPLCRTETLTVPGTVQPSRVRACLYAPGLQLTLTRQDAAATILSLLAERSSVP